MRITLNVAQDKFDNASGGDFPLIPAGKYKANVFAAEAAECQSTNNKGKPQVKVQFKLQDGQGQDNRRLFKTFNFFGDNPFDTINFLKALGFDYTQIAVEGIDTEDLLGEELEITVKHRKKMSKESGYKKPVEPEEFMEEVSGYRSMDAASTAGKGKTLAGAGGKFTL